MRELVTFFRPGIAVPQNNLKVGRHGQLYHGNSGLTPWRAGLTYSAQLALPDDWELYPDAVELYAVYFYARPKSNKSKFKVTVPDVGNLDKSLEDALSGVVYVDDKQIVHHSTWKKWVDLDNEEPGVLVRVVALGV